MSMTLMPHVHNLQQQHSHAQLVVQISRQRMALQLTVLSVKNRVCAFVVAFAVGTGISSDLTS